MEDEEKEEPSEILEDVNLEESAAGESIQEEKYYLDDHRDFPHAIGYWAAFFHITKAAIGTGILAISWAFKRSGTVGGVLWTVILGVIGGNSHYQLINSSQNLCERLRVPSLKYQDISEQCFRLGPKQIQKYALTSRYVTNGFLLFTMLGICAVYLVFAAEHFKQFFDYHTNSDLDKRTYICILTIMLVFLNFIRNLSYLAPLSALAMVGETVGLIITLYYVYQDLPSFDSRPYFVWELGDLMLYLGTVIFAIQSVCTVSAVEAEMRHPRQLIVCPYGALYFSYLLIVGFTTLVGFSGYWKYDDPQGSMILNLPVNETAAQAAKIMYGGGIFLSHALYFYVPFNIMWPTLKKARWIEGSEENQLLMWELLYRAILVLFTGGIAIGVPLLGALINIVGAVSLSVLTYVFPPFINLVTFWEQKKFEPWVHKLLRVKDFVLISIGLILFVAGTYASIINLIDELKNQ